MFLIDERETLSKTKDFLFKVFLKETFKKHITYLLVYVEC